MLPWLLLINELDKMDGKDVSALRSLMEGGRVSRIKVGRMADATLECRVVVACNTLRLPPELLSRIAIRRLHPYTTEQFREVVVGLLPRWESSGPLNSCWLRRRGKRSGQPWGSLLSASDMASWDSF